MKIIRYNRIHIRVLLLICITLIHYTDLKAQKLEPTFTFSLNSASLEEFIKQIEDHSEYTFIYGEEIRLQRKITIRFKQKTLKEVLNQVFESEPISYQLKGKHILLQKRKEQKPVSRKFTISGYVTDGTSSETLIGANITESRQLQGTTTNPYGFYSITLPEGDVTLKYIYLGYEEEKRRFTLTKDTLLNIRMEDNNLLQEVVITFDKTEAGNMATQMGATEIPIAQIKHTPSILGEADVMKAILPNPPYLLVHRVSVG